MTIKKLVALIEKEQEENAEEYMHLTDNAAIAYADGRGDALSYVLALIEEGDLYGEKWDGDKDAAD